MTFEQRLAEGERYEAKVAQRLATDLGTYGGFLVQTTVKPEKPCTDWYTQNQTDIWVFYPATGRFVGVEVKSRSIVFSAKPESFPYPTIFVDRASTYDAKTVKPYATLHISTETKDVLALPGASKPTWSLVSKWDHKQSRQMPEAYEAPKEALITYRAFTRELRDWLEYGDED